MAILPEQSLVLNNRDARTQWAAFAIREQLAAIQKQIPEKVLPTRGDGTDAGVDILYPVEGTKFINEEIVPNIDKFKVAIIGAGAAGLFTAMILDYLNDKFSLNVDYDIIESRDRVGGRLFTHEFKLDNDTTSSKSPSKLYYDVGAMRFPDIVIMKRTFELFKKLNMDKKSLKEATQKGDLVPYYLQGENIPSLYNDVRAPNKYEFKGFVPTGKEFKITGLPIDVAKANPGDLLSDSIDIFTSYYYTEGPEKFWKKLKRQADPYTVRQWLTQAEGYDYNTVEFLETMNFGNRWYDQALSEMILETLDFDSRQYRDEVQWRCVLGGAQVIPEKMREQLKQKDEVDPKNDKVKLNARVTVMKYKNPNPFVDHDPGEIEVTTEAQVVTTHIDVIQTDTSKSTNTTQKTSTVTSTKTYHAVFNSAPLGAMQRMQLEGLNLSWGVKQGIRSLGYGSSCKVGVLFKTQWWRDTEKTKLNIWQGGASKTDRPIRCCVYPSYNIEEPVDKPAVLLVSYTWSQEAIRMGSLIRNDHPSASEELKQVIIHDLARLHAIQNSEGDPDKDFNDLKERISKDYIEHFGYDWSQDSHAAGAFAYFGPSQFQQLYPWITRSGGSNHIIIGEAASSHHAWVVGALESAVRGVYQFLASHGKYNKKIARAAQAYERTPQDTFISIPRDGKNKDVKQDPAGERPHVDGETIPWPFGPLPAEYDFTSDIHVPVPSDDSLTDEKVPAKIGQLARLQVLMEQLRIKQGTDKINAKQVTKDDLEGLLGVPSAT